MSYKNIFKLRNLLLLVLLSVILLYSYFLLQNPVQSDEGVFLTAARMVKDGAVPYRDFVDHKPPGIYWLLAPIFVITDSGIQAIYLARILLLVINLLTTLILFLALKKFFASYNLIIALIIFLWINLTMSYWYWFFTEQPMILFILLGILLLLKYYENLNQKLLFFAGLSIGLAALFKQPAIFAALTVAIFLIICNPNPENPKIKSLSAFFKNQFLLWIGFAIPYLLTIFYFFINNSLSDFFHYVVTVNIASYPSDGISAFLYFYKINFISFLPFWALTFIAITFAVKHPLLFSRARWEIFFLIMLGFFFIPTFIRQYEHYYYPIMTFSTFLIGNAVDKLYKTGWIRRFFLTDLKNLSLALANFLIIFIGFPITVVFPISFIEYISANNQILSQNNLKQQIQTANKIKIIAATEEKIYVFNHSPEYYLLSDKKIADRNFYMVDFNSSSQKELTEKISSQKLTYVFIDRNREKKYASRTFAIFYKFIDENYKLSGEIGDLKVYKQIDDETKETSVNQEK